MIIFPVGFSFILSPFQDHNALHKAQMRYRLLFSNVEHTINCKFETNNIPHFIFQLKIVAVRRETISIEKVMFTS